MDMDRWQCLELLQLGDSQPSKGTYQDCLYIFLGDNSANGWIGNKCQFHYHFICSFVQVLIFVFGRFLLTGNSDLILFPLDLYCSPDRF